MDDAPDVPDEAERAATVTRLLHEAIASQLGGGPEAAEAILPHVYDELRALARARMAREAPGQTIQATALVHEAYVRLVGEADPGWNGRGHFFGAAALAMRRILVEQARRRGRLKHGGAHQRVDLDDDGPAVGEGMNDTIVAIDDAIRRLERSDPRKGQIVNLRYFAGLTVEDTAAALGVSVGTIEREWRFIKAFIKDALAT